MKTMFNKEVHGSGTDIVEDVDATAQPKIINNVNINNVDPFIEEEISEEKMRYVDSIINKITTAHRSSPTILRKESAEDLQELNEEYKSSSEIGSDEENNVNNKSDSINIKKEDIRTLRQDSPEKDHKLDWSNLKFNDLQIEISNCGNIIFEPPTNEDEAVKLK